MVKYAIETVIYKSLGPLDATHPHLGQLTQIKPFLVEASLTVIVIIKCQDLRFFRVLFRVKCNLNMVRNLDIKYDIPVKITLNLITNHSIRPKTAKNYGFIGINALKGITKTVSMQ